MPAIGINPPSDAVSLPNQRDLGVLHLVNDSGNLTLRKLHHLRLQIFKRWRVVVLTLHDLFQNE